jgi:hypothetical protein
LESKKELPATTNHKTINYKLLGNIIGRSSTAKKTTKWRRS